MPTEEELQVLARERARAKVGFYLHLAIYTGVNLYLIALWWLISGPDTFPWFVFPLVGWGAGLVAHYFGVFRGRRFMERLTEQEYRRLRQEGR